MRSLMDYGFKDVMIRKSESPNFLKFNEEKKFKPIYYFSPLKSTAEYFPDD